MRTWIGRFPAALGVAVLLGMPMIAAAQDVSEEERKAGMELYGFIMVDAVYDHTGIQADWLDAARPTKLPSVEDEFGLPGQFFFGVKQTRFGLAAHAPTKAGEVNAVLDFDLFGTGVDAGQTTLRLRHAYVSLGQFLFGQTESAFMDLDIFPNEIDYWGPNGMVFFRNVQFRWTPISGDNTLMFALERPGASADQGSYADRIELTDVVARFPVPDFSAAYKWGGHKWGYLRVSGILRYIKWDDLGDVPLDLAGDAVGWGVSVSSNINTDPKVVLRLEAVYGEGVENYMNDAPVDVGIEDNPGNLEKPFVGKAVPVLGLVAFYDRTLNEKFSTTFGWSMINITNTDGMLPNAFHQGQYGLVNLMYYPVPGMMVGPEVQYIWRSNFSDGFSTGGFRLQVSGKYNFKANIGAK